jgi:hypoxanthine phosphoribosyltransferase
VSNLVAPARAFKPDVIIAIGGGGFIPARMLRTALKVPVLAISLELYDDNTNTRNATVKKTQWFDEQSGVGSQVRGKRVLIMDEVDDTRTTLAYAVREVMETNAPSHIAVAVPSPHNEIIIECNMNVQSGLRMLRIRLEFLHGS